ncbi:MAG: hypothetical protein GPJ51_06195 [Candidatus Heimdallarchaeota archaeon]|nr:hypothetical protein [Candidatus Heimdallarchaeota archaeon]
MVYNNDLEPYAFDVDIALEYMGFGGFNFHCHPRETNSGLSVTILALSLIGLTINSISRRRTKGIT